MDMTTATVVHLRCIVEALSVTRKKSILKSVNWGGLYCLEICILLL